MKQPVSNDPNWSFFLASDLFDPNDLSREEIGLIRSDHLKKNVHVSLSARAAAYCDLCLLFITAPSSLYQRHLIRPDFALSLFTLRRHAQPTLHMDRVRGTTVCDAICMSPVSSLTHSCTWWRRDEEVGKTFTFL